MTPTDLQLLPPRELTPQPNSKEEAALAIEEQYSTLQEEVEIKTKKLQKVFQKWKAAEEELKEQAEENQREKEELLETARVTDRQVIGLGS